MSPNIDLKLTLDGNNLDHSIYIPAGLNTLKLPTLVTSHYYRRPRQFQDRSKRKVSLVRCMR